MTRTARYLLAAIVALLPATASAELLSEMSAYIITTGADGEPRYDTAETVEPGEIILYELIHKNTFDNEIGGVAIVGPIPEGSILVANSFSTSKPAVFEVRGEFDPDNPGEEWSTLPARRVVINSDGSRRTEGVGLGAVTAIRWRLDGELGQNEEVINQYQVRVLTDDETVSYEPILRNDPPAQASQSTNTAQSTDYEYGWMTGELPNTSLVAANIVRKPEFTGTKSERKIAIEIATTALTNDFCLASGENFIPDPEIVIFDDGINEWVIGGVCY